MYNVFICEPSFAAFNQDWDISRKYIEHVCGCVVVLLALTDEFDVYWLPEYMKMVLSVERSIYLRIIGIQMNI